MTADGFPMLVSIRFERYVRGLNRRPTIPWSMISPHDAQAHQNHSQSLKGLAKRGGLAPIEALWILDGARWDSYKMEEHIALVELERRIAEWEKEQA